MHVDAGLFSACEKGEDFLQSPLFPKRTFYSPLWKQMKAHVVEWSVTEQRGWKTVSWLN